MKQKKLQYTKKDVVLSLQHMFAMLGATIVVPILGNLNVSVTLLAMGLSTMAFYFIAEKKVPVFLGASFAFLPAYISILGSAGAIGSAGWNEQMGALSVALLFVGLLYFVFAFIVKKLGVAKMKKIFPTIVIAPIVILIGLILAPKMIYSNIVVNYVSGASPAWKEWTTAIVTAVTILVVNSYAPKRSAIKIMPILIGFLVGYLYAYFIGLVQLNGIFSGQIFVFQDVSKLFSFYGNLHINWGVILSVLPLAVVSIMEHIGDISANSIVCKKDFFEDPGIHKTLMADGTAGVIASVLGAPANTTYSENTAVLALTKNYNPRNLFLAGFFTVVLAIFTPFAEFLTSIPSSVIGGASFILFGMISSSGLRTLIEHKTDLNNNKNLMIMSIMLAIGLGLATLSILGDVTGDDAYKIMLFGVEVSPLVIATLLGVFLNTILPKEKETKQDTIDSHL
jgi:uracil permease